MLIVPCRTRPLFPIDSAGYAEIMASSFVGRAAQLESLLTLVEHAALEQQPVVALVLGDPGSGKSRLLNEARLRLGRRVLRVTGYEAAQRIPLAAAGELLRALAQAGPEGERLGSMMLEESGADEEQGIMRIFESAHRCLCRLGAQVVMVDDLQWLDEASISLCHYLLLGARAEEQDVAMICAARPLPPAHAFGAALRSTFGTSEKLQEMTLPPLTLAEGRQLALQLNPNLSATDAEGLCRKAEGSPFWLEVLVGAGESSSEPSRLIGTRLSRIDPDGASLMTLLVVAARPLALDEASTVLDWQSNRAENAARELAASGLVVWNGLTLSTGHDLIREHVGREVPSRTLRLMHVRLANHLERAAGDDIGMLREAIKHLQAAGMPASRPATRLARSPHRRLLGSDDLDHLTSIADAPEASREEALALNVDIASLAGELRQHEIALERWTMVWEHLPTPVERAEAALSAARAAFELGHSEQSHMLLEGARAADPGDSVLAIELDVHEALLLRWHAHAPERSEGLSRRAMAAAREMSTVGGHVALDQRARRAYLSALRCEFDAAFQSTDVQRSLSIANEMSIAAAGKGEQELKASISTALLAIEDGRVRDARPRLQRALDDACRQIWPTAHVEAAFWLAHCLRHLGSLLEASTYAAEACELAERVGTPTRMSVTWVRSLPHLLDVSRGSWPDGLRGLEDQLSHEPDPHYRLLLRYTIAGWTSRFAAPDDSNAVVREQLEAGSKDAAAAGCVRCQGEFQLRMAEALARCGEAVAANKLLARWDETHPLATGQQRLLRSWSGALTRQLQSGKQHVGPLLKELDEKAEALGFVLDGLWVRLDLGRSLAHHDRDGAVETLKSAAELAAELGALNEGQVALKALRSLGVRTWRRAARRGSLSDREHEIAELVAAGATNPEIAETLFVSRKTVERHVSNILHKLGARNRTELAGRFPENPPTSAGMRDFPDETRSSGP